jgi:uncharacterized protein YndB with AHSA1/START domain
MEHKTNINAEAGKQEIVITREFNLPVDLLFTAYVEPELVEQWMGTKVLKLESRKHGSFRFATTDPKGNTHHFNGTIHEFIPGEKITRTFEMENTPFDVWLEYLVFKKVTSDTSMLEMHVVYKSVEQRDQLLKMPFAQGINWAHNRLQEIVSTSKHFGKSVNLK